MTDVIEIGYPDLEIIYADSGDSVEIVEASNAIVNIINPSATYRITTQDYLSGANLSALRLVKLNASNQLVYADSSNDSTVLGLTFQAVNIGVAPIVVLSGLVTDSSWNWARGAPLYLSSNGAITETAPITGYIVAIGHAEAPTIINLNIMQGVQIN